MTRSQSQHRQAERSVAEQLGFSEAQIDALLDQVAHRKTGYFWPVNAAAAQRRQDDAVWNAVVEP